MTSAALKNYELSFMEKYLGDLRSVGCPLCRRNDAIIAGTGSRGGIEISSVICDSCSLIYLDPKPSKEIYHAFYASGDYRRFLNFVKGKKEAGNIDNYFTEEKFNERKDDGRRIAEEYFKGLLNKDDLYFDFGCDSGGIMAGVREEIGCRIMGNEPSQMCAEEIKNKLGISILCSSTEDISDEVKERYKCKVKLASVIGVLEHVSDPVACLKIAYDMLADDGYLYAESFDILRRMEMNTEAVEDVATIDHQYYFHKDVYVYMLELCGFEVVRFDYDDKNYKIMRVVAKKSTPKFLKTYDAKKIMREVMRLNERARLYRDSFSFLLKEATKNANWRIRQFAKVSIDRLARNRLKVIFNKK